MYVSLQLFYLVFIWKVYRANYAFARWEPLNTLNFIGLTYSWHLKFDWHCTSILKSKALRQSNLVCEDIMQLRTNALLPLCTSQKHGTFTNHISQNLRESNDILVVFKSSCLQYFTVNCILFERSCSASFQHYSQFLLCFGEYFHLMQEDSDTTIDTHAGGSAAFLMWQSESTKTYKRGT